ncbi:CDP-glycerol glycerophosphotransferase family protein [Geobacillus thermodenitrificans]|uniref:CDP-glycerol glycerophosphotransferase family protein n=1 Tax=Geobacillus thermodenitrificans TaxID=33940 RepID=UPI000D361A50|nr:CDP-glycerol glycerophosphotransferase family protein [Geobacillus thermodenitrificans]PTR48444.1 CDP-glycerol glycerophosphotransferase family protein [Geobacillus thermodenitrificans]
MGLLSFFWKPKVVKQYGLHSLLLEHGVLSIQINSVFEGQSLSRELLFVERETKQKLAFPLHTDEEPADSKLLVLKASIDIREHGDTIGQGNVWDVFVLEKSLDVKKKYRLKSQDFEPIQFFNQRMNREITPYTTVKGNLSLRVEPIHTVANVESVALSGDGKLLLRGYAFCADWDMADEASLTKYIVLKSKDGDYEQKFFASSEHRNDLTELYAYTGKNLDGAGFVANIDVRDIDFSAVDELDLYIELHYTKDPEKGGVAALTVLPSAALDYSPMVVHSEDEWGDKKVSLRVSKDRRVLSLDVSDYTVQVEITSIYAENNRIQMEGYIAAESAQLADGQYSIMIKRRYMEANYTIPVQIVQSKFSFDIDLEKAIGENLLREGVWDLYLSMPERNFRLVSRKDGIEDKQKIVQFPQQLLFNQEGVAVVVKPFYTLRNDVSILVRNYIYAKKVDKISFLPDQMRINGKINIMVPNDDVDGPFPGHILLRGEYGKTYRLPAEWRLRKTGRTEVEFAFSADAALEGEDKAALKAWILKNIKFDSLKCEIDFGSYQSHFSLNINPEKVEKTLEDKLNQRPRLKKVIDKGRLAVYYMMNKLLPIRPNVFIFQSYYGNSYACNPRALYEELLRQQWDMKAVWVMKDLDKQLPGNPVLVRPNSLKYYYYMAVGKYFINNGNFPDFYVKRKGTVHIQTWHGTPLKRLGLDVDPKSPAYAENTSPQLLNRVKRWDYLIAPNRYTAEILQRAYAYDKVTLEVGYPRNDIFYRPDRGQIAEQVKQRLNIEKGKKVILYAPTWRDTDQKGAPYEFRFDLERFREEFGQEYVLLLRLHYFDASRIQLVGYEDFVYNVTYYDDIQELYLISDILITDYSSVMFDYANLNRPMIFFTYDLVRYGSQLRGFYFNFKEEAPGPLVLHEADLFDAIRHIGQVQAKYQDKYEAFRERFCSLEDGHASERAIRMIFGK